MEKGQQDSLMQQEKRLKDEQAKCQEVYDDYLLKKQILEEASTKAREEGKLLFENMVTNGLQMVFDRHASIQIKLGKKSNLATADVFLRFNKNGKIVTTDPTTEDSGGVADITSLGLFMCNSLLCGKENQAGFFLDEPTKFVSASRAEFAANFINEMVRYTQKQTILTTHELSYLPFVADRSFLIEIDENGVSQAERYTEGGELVLNKEKSIL